MIAPRVSNHAIDRYLLRVAGVNLLHTDLCPHAFNLVRDAVAENAALPAGFPFGHRAQKWRKFKGDFVYVVNEGAVVTVLLKDRLPRDGSKVTIAEVD